MSSASVRVARSADVPALAVLAAELEQQTLFVRYQICASTLHQEFCSLAQSTPVHETLLLAFSDDNQQIPIGMSRVVHSGMFGHIGGYLKLIAVCRNAQGKGIGSLLLSASERLVLAHSRDLFLLASDFNEAAHTFYLRHGYSHVGSLPDFVRPGITEFIFRKRLGPKT